MGEETFNAMPDPPLAGQLNMNELQQLFELAPFGIGVFDRHFRCRSVNQTLADLNGLSREEHYGRYLREIVPTLAPVLEPLFQQIISSGVPRVELNLSGHTAAHQGRQRHWQAIYSPMLDEQGVPDRILTIVRDVTEQVEAQQRLQLAMSAGQIGVWEWHVTEDRLQFDGQVERLLGTTASQFQGGMEQFIKRFDPLSGEQFRAVVNGTAPIHLTLGYLGPDQLRGWVDIHADHVAATDHQGRRITGVIHDATSRCNQEDKLRQANVVFETAAEGIIIMDGQRQIISVNPAFSSMTQYEEAEIVGKSPEAIMHPRRHTDIDYPWHTLLPGSHAWHGEMMCLRKDGGYFTSWQHVSAVHDSRHNTTNYVIAFSDISAIRKAEAQLNHLAYHDPLTELGNRNLLQERLELELKTAQLNHQQLALLFIDLDGFKLINDTLGHRAGDELLKLLAERIRRVLRHNDVAARLGGDEFLVLIPFFERPQELERLAEQLLASLREPVELGNERVAVSASIGIALYPEHATSPDTLVSAADSAMYEAKNRGRNGYLFYTPDMTEQTRERMSMEQGLFKAIEQHQLCVLYQPMTELASNRMSGLEALLRWQHPSEGMIGPTRFIPVAEECGLIEQIGEWVMRTACRQGQAWLAAGLAVPRLSINVSVREMRSAGYVERVAAILAETGFPPEKLEIEVTESIIQRVDQSLQLFRRLKALGVQIAIDDFGTGFSSLSLLKSLPIDRIKIDRTFVQALPDDKHSRELCRTIINLADSLGMVVTAEGIETQAQRQFLQSLHCQEGQGYLFSHPLAEPHLAEQLGSRKGTWC